MSRATAVEANEPAPAAAAAHDDDAAAVADPRDDEDDGPAAFGDDIAGKSKSKSEDEPARAPTPPAPPRKVSRRRAGCTEKRGNVSGLHASQT